jgi:hypothetical protein
VGAPDTVVSFEIGRTVVMRRLIARTVRRAVTREVLWNGNREPLSNFYRWGPSTNIIRWSWVHYLGYTQRHRDAAADPHYAHIEFIRFDSPRQVDRFWA